MTCQMGAPARGQPSPRVPAFSGDPENCLSCHRFRGLSRLDSDTGEVRLFSCSIEYYAYQQGPHSRLRCTDCHKRDEVAVIPHQVQTPVDCTRACHIQSATGVAVEFSHASVAQRLEHSAHSPGMLRNLRLSEPLLRPGQSECLYCHDEPMFREPIHNSIRARAGEPEARCDTCHAQTLPLDTGFFTQHVLSRLQPARSIRPMAQTCAVCHSDPEVIAQFDSHDTVASYLHSFHGKASLLGSTETATCVDCHRSSFGDVHLMLGSNDPQSSTHPERLGTTCRTTECHPSAPPEMTVAAVHLNLDPGKPTLEYFVAAAFILLTASVMLVYMFLIILEMLNHMFRRRDPEHHRLVALAKLLQSNPQARAMLQRTTPHQRVQHWLLAIFFILLALTGMPLKFADSDWAASIVRMLGGLAIARDLHRIAGVILIAVFLYHVAYLFGVAIQCRRANRRAGRNESLFRMALQYPMVVTVKDVRQFGQLFAYLLLPNRKRPAFGQYNFMEKFEYWAVFWGMPVMGLTGIALWAAGWIAQNFSGRALNFAFIIHSDEAFLAFIYIAVVHMFYVIFAPSVFPLSRGTLSGQAPAGEMAEGHRQRLEDVARTLNIQVPDSIPAHHSFTARAVNLIGRAYAGVVLCGVAFIGFLSMRFLLTALLATHHLPADIGEIPKRLTAETLRTGMQNAGPAARFPQSPIRTPLAHFHQIPQWQDVILGTNCTTSGCHAPLPHHKRIEVRAFLNMHSTYVDCMVCHGRTDQPLQVQWSTAEATTPQPTPAVLQVATMVEGKVPDDAAEMRAYHEELLKLLDLAIRQTGGNPELKRWRLRLDTSKPDNEIWSQAIAEIQAGIGLHVHGEYAALLHYFAGDAKHGTPTSAELAATQEYLNEKSTPTESRKQELLDTIHEPVRPGGLACMTCHSPKGSLVDFERLGYPPSRTEWLKNNATINQILAIEAGQTFYLPGFIGTDDRD